MKSIDHVWKQIFPSLNDIAQVFRKISDRHSMKFTAFILALLILPACGGFSLFKNSKSYGRKISSIESTVKVEDFETELKSLHHYHLLALKNRTADESRQFVIKTKIEEIESALLKKKSSVLKTAVSEFADKSVMAAESVKNVAFKLGLETKVNTDNVSEQSVDGALKLAESTKEFQILSMNIEHLTHMMNLKLKNTPPRKTSLDWMAQHPDKIIKRTKKLI